MPRVASSFPEFSVWARASKGLSTVDVTLPEVPHKWTEIHNCMWPDGMHFRITKLTVVQWSPYSIIFYGSCPSRLLETGRNHAHLLLHSVSLNKFMEHILLEIMTKPMKNKKKVDTFQLAGIHQALTNYAFCDAGTRGQQSHSLSCFYEVFQKAFLSIFIDKMEIYDADRW